MTLMLDLPPTLEKELEASAQRDGLPISEHASRLLASALRLNAIAQRRAEMEAQASRAFDASGETEEEMKAFVIATLKQYRAEVR